MIIDHIFVGLLLALDPHNVKSFILLEMRIASKGEMVEIDHGSYKTLLTGSVDYAFLTVLPEDSIDSISNKTQTDPPLGIVCTH